MTLWKKLLIGLTCAAALSLSIPDDAEARRLGGGRSFGGSPAFNRAAPVPRAPGGVVAQQPGTSQNRQAVNPAAGAATATRGFGGMFTGLLAGSLIGSLLMGHGFAGGGLLDIVVIGLLAYLVYRAVNGRGRRTEKQDPAYQNGYRQSEYGQSSAWDSLKTPFAGGRGEQTDAPSSRSIPRDFDQDVFLRGAKMAYARLQESWDKRDLEDIAQFASPAIMDVLREQMAEDPAPSTTELLLVNAGLLEVKNAEGKQRASVFFDVLMREDPKAQNPEQVREIWHFIRNADQRANWLLDGIQQIE